MFKPPPFTCKFASLLFAGWFASSSATAVVFFDTADPNHNTTAPTGTYADSGWRYEGVFGDNLGTTIGSQYFITAAHVSVETSFVRLGILTGGVDTTYTVDSGAFGGAGFYTVPGTDLRVFKINETFTDWAELYTGTTEVGLTSVIHGKGGQRGADVFLDTGNGAELKGWLGTGTQRVPRWGTNQITGVLPSALSPVGDLLTANFDALPGTDEAMLTGNDSGGGLFIRDLDGVWRLAGLNYGVEGAFNTTPSDIGAFNGALFDKGGYWQGQGSNFQFNPDTPVNDPQTLYASRVSPYADQIKSITGVPEPGSVMLLLAVVAVRRRRRN